MARHGIPTSEDARLPGGTPGGHRGTPGGPAGARGGGRACQHLGSQAAVGCLTLEPGPRDPLWTPLCTKIKAGARRSWCESAPTLHYMGIPAFPLKILQKRWLTEPVIREPGGFIETLDVSQVKRGRQKKKKKKILTSADTITSFCISQCRQLETLDVRSVFTARSETPAPQKLVFA